MTGIAQRLFIAIWLSLISAVLVAAGAALASFSKLANEPVPVARDAQAAAAALAQGGREQLLSWMTARDSDTDARLIYAVDEQGNDLLGRPLPPRLQQALNNRRTTIESVELRQSSPFYELVARDGSSYQLILLPPPGSPIASMSTGTAAALLAILLFVTGTLSAILARRFTSPLRALTGAMRRVGAGELQVQLPDNLTHRRDEIGVLSGSFNRMTHRLNQQQSSRQNLLRDLSHQLRSPATRLRMTLDLARGKLDNIAAERAIKEIYTLEELVSQILDLSRLDTDTGALRMELLDFVEIVDPIACDARFEAEQLGKQLHWEAPTAAIPVNADRVWLGMAIENVMRNAVRVGPVNKAIEVALSTNAGQVLLSIRDYGEGVPENELEQIFEPFFRRQKNTDSPGSGVGLAITARVLKLHGGTVTARNAAGGGLEVQFVIPIRGAGH